MSTPSAVDAERREFAKAIVLGLHDTPRWLPCRFLYDAEGSALFESITEQPEYYPTRIEAAILAKQGPTIARLTGPVTLIELGSGSSLKTDHVLTAYAANATAANDVVYVPIDVSDSAIEQATQRIADEHSGVSVSGIVGTYEEAFPLMKQHSPAMVMFLGSTIGNFNQTESLIFWQRVSASLQVGDYFLLGADLVKPRHVLEAAYNDAAGITPRFTKNLFARMNRELGADIDLDALEHVARFNDRWQRIETFMRFHKAQTIHIAPMGTDIEIAAGDQIMIEISRKFVLRDLRQFLSTFGFETVQTFTDDKQWFGELLLRKIA